MRRAPDGKLVPVPQSTAQEMLNEKHELRSDPTTPQISHMPKKDINIVEESTQRGPRDPNDMLGEEPPRRRDSLMELAAQQQKTEVEESEISSEAQSETISTQR